MTGDLANGIYAGSNSVSIRNIGRIETFELGAPGHFRKRRQFICREWKHGSHARRFL